jgi:luciferase family oxidoreductase group 1
MVPLSFLDLGYDIDLAFDAIAEMERLGYARYWFAEHAGRAHCAPTIMSAVAAGLTSRIRVGTAGVLLRYHSPMTIAHGFKLLERLYGRFDGGFCAGEIVGAEAIPFAGSDALSYEEKTEMLVGLVRGHFGAEHPLADAVVPPAGSPCELWYHGSSPRGASRAARLGVGFGYALHFRQSRDDPSAVRRYHAEFEPNAWMSAPRSCLSVSGFCSDSVAEIQRVREIQARRAVYARASVVGSPAEIRTQLHALVERYGCSELVFVDIAQTVDPPTLARSAALVAEAMGRAAD